MNVDVTSDVIARLREESLRAHPEECCGILLGGAGQQDGERIYGALPAANVAAEPARHFEIDPVTLLAAHRAAREGGPRILGYYHSHPTGHPVPSATDCEHSTGDLRVWAIIGDGQVAFWRDTGNGFAPMTCRIVE